MEKEGEREEENKGVMEGEGEREGEWRNAEERKERE